MDDRTFDAVARAVSAGTSRRQALRLLAAGALTAWLPRGAVAALARQECEAGLIYCPPRSDGQPEGCYDLLSDYFHCGSCDVSCPSAGGPAACIGGACVATGCAAGWTDCTGNLDCVDLSSDPFNCGGCGVVCDSGVCEAGSCAQVGCPAGSWDCEGTGICTSFLDDPFHCGDCGTVCASGVCEGGFCTQVGCAPGLVACPYSEHLGPAGCYDLATDPNRCGSCETSCGGAGSRTIEACIEGSCVATGCIEGFIDCDGSGSCTRLADDPNNCGACGVVCPSGVCNDGVCAEDTTCAAGLAYCPARQITVGFDNTPSELPAGCYDLVSDRTHCGSCDVTCPTTVGCYAGECGLPPCDEGLTQCAAGCVDLLSDPNHCGACDIVCAAGEACDGGVCGPDTTCAAGLTYCPAKTGVQDHPAGCYDLSADAYHCGSCDNSCATVGGPGNLICVAGDCQSCSEGTRCGNVCYDLSADPNHCGICNVACAAGEVCEGGTCTATTTRAITDDGTPTTTSADAVTRAQDAGESDRTTADRPGRTTRIGETARAPRSGTTAAPESVLSWPFDPEAGQWTIVRGYRGEDEATTTVATPLAGVGDYTRFAFDVAVCRPGDVDREDGTCDLGPSSANSGADGGDPGWDAKATQGADVLSPVDGTVAWTAEASAPCQSVGINITGHSGYRVALLNVEGYPERGQSVKRGRRIGKVAKGGCEGGGALSMVLYQPQPGAADDPEAGREGVPFAGEWAIDDCDYPDDKRTVNQYRAELVPCNPEDVGSASS